jgi:ubiquinone/menaquinone biosynthesis C-methylase UbiE
MEVLEIHKLNDSFVESNIRSPSIPISEQIKKVERLIDFRKFSTVIDFGCGDGKFANSLSDIFTSTNFIGVDYSNDFIDYAKKNYSKKNLDFLCVNLTNDTLPIQSESVDCIFSWGVMHHINPNLYPKYQLELFRVLKSGGNIVHFYIDYMPYFFKGLNWKGILASLPGLITRKKTSVSYHYTKSDFLHKSFVEYIKDFEMQYDSFQPQRIIVIYTKK